MNLQIHVTTSCEHNCTHCYYENSSELPKDMDWETFLYIINDANNSWPSDLQVSIAGGNPLLWPKIKKAMALLSSKSIPYGLLGNPSLITTEPDWLELLVTFNTSFFQISLEGLESTTDAIRGLKTFEKSIKAIEKLVSFGIPVFVMSTVHKKTIEEIPKLLMVLDDLKVTSFDCAPYVPLGKFDVSYLPNPSEYRRFLKSLIEAASNCRNVNIGLKDPLCHVFLNEVGIFLDSSIPLLERKCKIARSILAIETDGRIYPCRRLPVSLGKSPEISLDEAIAKARSFISSSDKCIECKFSFCRVGMPCVSYAIDNATKPYPLCWIV